MTEIVFGGASWRISQKLAGTSLSASNAPVKLVVLDNGVMRGSERCTKGWTSRDSSLQSTSFSLREPLVETDAADTRVTERHK
ncbi:hypothetical protein CS8_050250 [Cupriavidus sp. 8B]